MTKILAESLYEFRASVESVDAEELNEGLMLPKTKKGLIELAAQELTAEIISSRPDLMKSLINQWTGKGDTALKAKKILAQSPGKYAKLLNQMLKGWKKNIDGGGKNTLVLKWDPNLKTLKPIMSTPSGGSGGGIKA